MPVLAFGGEATFGPGIGEVADGRQGEAVQQAVLASACKPVSHI